MSQFYYVKILPVSDAVHEFSALLWIRKVHLGDRLFLFIFFMFPLFSLAEFRAEQKFDEAHCFNSMSRVLSSGRMAFFCVVDLNGLMAPPALSVEITNQKVYYLEISPYQKS